MDAILDRRSIRKYKPEAVEPAQIEALLRAAMHAPSAHNRQLWHFIVCTDRQELAEFDRMHPYASMLKQAPVCIVVCADLSLESGESFYQQDCAAATENILICAQDMGLGACWMGVAPDKTRMEDFKSYLKLPAQVEVFSLIAVGWPDEKKKRAEDRYKPERVHHDKW